MHARLESGTVMTHKIAEQFYVNCASNFGRGGLLFKSNSHIAEQEAIAIGDPLKTEAKKNGLMIWRCCAHNVKQHEMIMTEKSRHTNGN